MDHALKCELAAEVLRSTGTLTLQVTGWSMLPSMFSGDMLTIQRPDAETAARLVVGVHAFRQRSQDPKS